MNGQLRIIVDKQGVPQGEVLLDDAGALLFGVWEILARLIQSQIGLPIRGKLRKEAKELCRLTLSGLSEGSGVLECTPLKQAGAFRSPSDVVAEDLVRGLRDFAKTDRWPGYLHPAIRNRLGNIVNPLVAANSNLRLEFRRGGADPVAARLSEEIVGALKEEEDFALDEEIRVVGKMYAIDTANRTFKVNTRPKRVTVDYSEALEDLVDELRWGRVAFSAIPVDRKASKLINPRLLRSAHTDESDSIELPGDSRDGEESPAYAAVLSRAEELRQLEADWDSYKAPKPDNRMIDAALDLVKGVAGNLARHQVDMLEPFLVPTPKGGVQLEWVKGPRELEIEIPELNEFRFLKIDGASEQEGAASRWEVGRLINWISTGEEV